MLIACEKTKPDKTNICYFDCPVDFSVREGESAWSPDGKYIAYVHGDKEAGKTGIYLITPEGKENRLWHAGIGAQTPSWSPDGQWIAFSDGAQIWKKKFNGDSLKKVTSEGRNFFPSWSPNYKWIVYHRSYSFPESEKIQGIWLIDIYGLNKNQIFSGNSGFPIWNNLNDIFFLRGVTTTTGHVIGDSLKRYLSDEKGISTVFFIPGDNSYPKYSAKGNKLVFTNQINNSAPQIYSINADGTGLKRLTNTQGYTCDWSPDGRYIVYTDSRAVNGRLWIMNADGANKHQLTFGENF